MSKLLWRYRASDACRGIVHRFSAAVIAIQRATTCEEYEENNAAVQRKYTDVGPTRNQINDGI